MLSKFFSLPDGTIIDTGYKSHWKWIEDASGYKKARTLAMQQGTMLPLFMKGWWRGTLFMSGNKYEIAFETFPFPSRNKIMDRVLDVMQTVNLNTKQIAGVEVEVDIHDKSGRRYSRHKTYPNIFESQFMDGVEDLLEAKWSARLKSKRHKDTGRRVGKPDLYRYTCGECHIYALALQKMFGYKLGILYDDSEHDENQEMGDEDSDFHPMLYHVFAYKPGSPWVVDINGKTSKQRMTRDFSIGDPGWDFPVDASDVWNLSRRGTLKPIFRDDIRRAMHVIADNRAKYEIKT